MRLTESGPASPALVWARLEDPVLWPTWSPQIRRVDWPGGPLEAGMTGVVHPLVGPTVHFAITDLDRSARTWTWLVGRGPVRLRMAHGVDRTTIGSQAWLELSPLVGVPYAPLASWALKRLVS